MAPTTLQQERRELWNSILEEVRQSDPEPDPARAAACSYLLGHLIHSAALPGGYRFTGTASSKMFCGN